MTPHPCAVPGPTVCDEASGGCDKTATCDGIGADMNAYRSGKNERKNHNCSSSGGGVGGGGSSSSSNKTRTETYFPFWCGVGRTQTSQVLIK